MYQKPSLSLAGRQGLPLAQLVKTYLLVKSTPLTVNLARFQELINAPRLLDFQHRVPEPSLVKGAVMVALTGLHAPPPLPDVGVRVAVGPLPGVGVRVRVAVGPLPGVD